jgi:exopolyphosphatase / guanosine-5'-triphosphate,3'-diphosphate pyrophosphatase
MKIAAIDIGSNSMKLAVAEVNGSDFNVTQRDRRRVRLAAMFTEEFVLSGDAFMQARKAMSELCAVAHENGADVIIAAATAAIREAVNRDEFVGEMETLTGIQIRILSDIEEAMLTGLAAYHQIKHGALLNIDIGGGSTELCLMKDGVPARFISIPIGAVNLTRECLSGDPPGDSELAALCTRIEARLLPAHAELKDESWEITTGTSGTILHFASLLGFGETEIPLSRIGGLNSVLARLTIEERTRLPNLSRERAEIIVAGGRILESVMRVLGVDRLRPCSFALREGLIIEYLNATVK